MSASDLLGTKTLLATDGSEEAELATRVAVAMAERTVTPSCTWSMSNRCPSS